ncbi:MAG: ergothioneine biosynthesis protein EgtC [Legionellales bacterium]|nr:ergothioneine biosynthesis protein EgtC [Legionellales bacterium]
MMCRLAAYIGAKISLSVFLKEHEHNLIQQSWAPKEMQNGILNADGYGIAWLSEKNIPSSYKNILPIWSDTNLNSLARSLSSQLWLANIRGATLGQGISESNTQPFIKDSFIFTHNGSLEPFNDLTKANFLDILPSTIITGITGNSDSLYLFALLRHHLERQDSISNAIISMMDDLKSICRHSISALVNIIISDGNSLYACRHALNGECPSLYYLFNQDNVWIASEPLSPNDTWVSFPENSFIRFNRAGVIEEHHL